MVKVGTPLRQRKVHNHDKNGEDDADDEILNEFAASDRSRKLWLLIIAVLVILNVVLGGFHIHKRVKQWQAAAQEGDSIIKALTDESLPLHVAGHPNGTLVNFHVPACTYCKKLAPEFEAAARELQKVCDTSLVSVDATLAPMALKQYSVTRFPTLLWFRRGELLKDVSPSVRTASKIVEFVDQALQPAVIDFGSRSQFDEAVPQLRSVLRGESQPVIVGFGREPNVYEALQQAGEKFRGSTAFLFVTEAHAEDPSIRAYFRDPEADQEYNGNAGSQDVQNWLRPLMEKSAKKPAASN